MALKLYEPYKPAGDQPAAIAKLTASLRAGHAVQTLLGVTGSGKTYTVAHAIAALQKPTLVIAHNKTLAAQLTQEFRTFFPTANVEYFVSYYDYYQPEAYLPGSDVYIEKEAEINDEIDRLRHAATSALLRDPSSTIVVASVSCIYGLGSPAAYANAVLDLGVGDSISRPDLIQRLVSLYYERSRILGRGRFNVQGSTIEIVPQNQERIVRLTLTNDRVASITVDELTSRTRIDQPERTLIFPAKHFVATPDQVVRALRSIEEELTDRLGELRRDHQTIEADRLERRTRYDLRLIREIGICPGIENYSRHFAGRSAGEAPETLIDYFAAATAAATPTVAGSEGGFLIVVDESHVSIPQIRGMYAGDQARKNALVDHGFRLPSARDNRPLTFQEFIDRTPQRLFVSATPGLYELTESLAVVGRASVEPTDIQTAIVRDDTLTIIQQVIRPTGLVDPDVTVRPVTNEVQDAIGEISREVAAGHRVLVTALTKKMAEDLSEFLVERMIRARYLHSGVETLERITLLRDLRRGTFDVLVGVNLLREGLDLPEVSLVIVLDADNEGFLRSATSLIQTIGRAARNVRGRVILYADTVTESMRRAIEETTRRRARQLKHNQVHGITPASIRKAIETIRPEEETPVVPEFTQVTDVDTLLKMIRERTAEMKRLAQALEFEQAALVRDELTQLQRLHRQFGER